MENPPLLHEAHGLLGRIGVHQDFFWFFSLLVWSLALIVWWRHPARRAAWVWLPGAAGATVVMALVQFGMFNPTFDIFLERLVPGTVSNYKPALIDPYWLGDVLIGTALATMVAAWGWAVARLSGRPRLRWLPGLIMAGVVAIHAVAPLAGGLLLSGLAVVAAAALWRQTKSTIVARLGLLLAALLPALSTVGPAAAWLGMIQRAGPPTTWGLAAAFFQMLVGTLMLAGLARGFGSRLAPDTRAAFRRDARWFGLGALLLLAAGLAYGIQTGRDNRREIQQNRLRTTAAHARVFDPALLAPLHAPEFHIAWKSAAGESAPAQSAWLASGVAEPARRELEKVLFSTPFLEEARMLIVRDGWLVNVLSSAKAPGPIEMLRRATPDDLRRWEKKEPYVEESPVPEIGYDYYCRAPIVTPDGQMLGWLDCVRREYFLSVERRWRAAPFLVTGLGLVLLSLVVVQRQDTRERATALRAAAISAEGLRVKTAFLANVSHELRTPLQNILGYSELLRQELGDTHLARLDALRQQGELMTRLVNDLIDLSTVESGSFQLVARPVAPAEIVRQTIESLRPRAAAKGLVLRCAIGNEVPAWVTADGDRLRQVLLNLSGNALKFTDHGTVTVSLRAEPVPEGKTRLILTVDDTGPGISTAQQARLFVPFSRLPQTADKEGSGLGLALSAALCRAMGGAIAVESDGQTGSRFTASILVAPAVAPKSVHPRVRSASGFVPRVLVVDDNRLVRELFAAALTEHGAACRLAADGTAALARLAEEIPDVIVLDLALPDGDGADLTPRLRALAPAVRVIGVSAHAGTADRTRALAAGMDEFLTKPVPLDALWAAVAGAVPAPESVTSYFDPPPALRERLQQEFLRELAVKQAGLAGAVEAGNWVQVRATAHYLRNSALVVGATTLYEACTGLETAATAADATAARLWWSRCTAALDALKSK